VFSLKLNQVNDYLKAAPYYINILSILQNSKKNNLSLYYRTDTHWTDMGAFITYQEIGNRQGFDFLKIEDLNIDKKKYDLWNGDDAPRFFNSPTHPEFDVILTPKKLAKERKKLKSVLIFGDSYIHTKRGIPKQ